MEISTDTLLNHIALLKNNDDEFVIGESSFADVYSLAAGILDISETLKSDKPVCLCTNSKTLTAAAVIASYIGGMQVILPNSFSENILDEIRTSLDIPVFMTDTPDSLSIAADIIKPVPVKEPDMSGRNPESTDNVFIQLYTGGSTGKNKVWGKTPGNLFSEALYLKHTFKFSKSDTFLATVPSFHIYGLLYSIMAPLLALSGVHRQTPVFPREITSMIENRMCSILISVPMHYKAIGSVIAGKGNLRAAFSSAGPLDPDDGKTFFRKTGIGVHEIYGSTETGGIAIRTFHEDGGGYTPFAVVDFKIIDDRLSVRSPFLSPDLAKEPDGFFITSDRAEIFEESRFILKGRADSIIKIGGKRIDTGEIEDKIKQIPGVLNAIVVSIPTERKERGRENEIHALIATKEEKEYIRKSMNKILHPLPAPRRIVLTDEIPLTSTGKYDRETIEGILLNKTDGEES